MQVGGLNLSLVPTLQIQDVDCNYLVVSQARQSVEEGPSHVKQVL